MIGHLESICYTSGGDISLNIYSRLTLSLFLRELQWASGC